MEALILVIMLLIASIIYIPAGLYFKLGWFKKFYHDIMGWCMPDNSPKSFDGCSIHSKCKYCGKDIMQDSQGNWF